MYIILFQGVAVVLSICSAYKWYKSSTIDILDPTKNPELYKDMKCHFNAIGIDIYKMKKALQVQANLNKQAAFLMVLTTAAQAISLVLQFLQYISH